MAHRKRLRRQTIEKELSRSCSSWPQALQAPRRLIMAWCDPCPLASDWSIKQDRWLGSDLMVDSSENVFRHFDPRLGGGTGLQHHYEAAGREDADAKMSLISASPAHQRGHFFVDLWSSLGAWPDCRISVEFFLAPISRKRSGSTTITTAGKYPKRLDPLVAHKSQLSVSSIEHSANWRDQSFAKTSVSNCFSLLTNMQENHTALDERKLLQKYREIADSFVSFALLYPESVITLWFQSNDETEL